MSPDDGLLDGTNVESNMFEIFYQNVRGLRSKVHDFYSATQANQFHLIALTETWLDSSFFNSELFCANYTVYRKDRNFDLTNTSRGGGVLLALDNKYSASLLNIDDITNAVPSVDTLGIKINLNASCLIVIVMYFPPSTSTQLYTLVFDLICSMPQLLDDTTNLIILGDFNIPSYATYKDAIFDVPNVISNIRNFSSFLGVTQYNSILNINERLLDLVFTRSYALVNLSDESLVPLPDRLHPSLEIIVPVKDNKTSPLKRSSNGFNFRKANFGQLYNDLLHTDWEFLKAFDDVNLACSEFYKKLHDTFSLSVPQKQQKISSYPPWFTGQIIRDIKRKSNLLAKFKRSADDNYFQQFKILRKKIKADISEARQVYARNAEQEIINNPSKFWFYINSLKNTSVMPSSMTYKGESLTDPIDIVNSFASFFQDSFIQSGDFDFMNIKSTNVGIPSLYIPNLSEEIVLKALKKCKAKLTAGPDDIPSFILRDCAYVFVKPLTLLFNLALKNSLFPDIWKKAKICPIFKKGDKSDIGNYRQITILCNFSKLFESVLFEYFSFHFTSQISFHQHGFLKGRSTVTNLTCFTQYVAEVLDSGGQVDVIYTDFTKAFDRLDHTILLQKLFNIGVSESLLYFLNSYLRDRKLVVQQYGYKSVEICATSGVPQGSVLGPLFFLIFINDICLDLQSNILLYADDCKIFNSIASTGDCSILQDDLRKLNLWCAHNSLFLNVNKCNVMSFYRGKSLVTYDYYIGTETLQRSYKLTDLGIVFDTKLTFNDHITIVTDKAYKSLGFIIRNSKSFTDINTLILLFNAFVRSKLDYAAVVWDPYYEIHKTSIEKIQRCFVKHLWFKSDNVYPEQGMSHSILLNRFNIIPLCTRRQQGNLIFLYKLLNGKVDCPMLINNLNFHVPRLPNRNNLTFYLPRARTNMLMSSPLYNMCSLCNLHADNLDIFNCKICDIKNLAN